MTTPITPQVGAWRYAEVTPVSSTCPAEVNGEAGNFAIDTASTTSFHVIPNDGTAPFTCSLAGARFNCPDRAAQTEDLRPTVDAVLMMQASAEGTFSSAVRGSGRQDATVSCAGSQCAAIGTWPCNLKVDFLIAAS